VTRTAPRSGSRPPLGRRIAVRLAAVAAALALTVTGLTALAPAEPAAALSGSDFNPGNIISDAKFFNGQAMGAGDIQAFLNAKVPSCRSGYTCLKSWTETTGSRPADAMCGAYNGVANETAAQIIYKVGAVCGVSQKVLLVLLQKEQSLVTDTYPSAGQFRSATGFACPDTAPCDAEYYGFYNQVYKAAWQYKRYTNPPGTSAFFTWFPVGQTANVRYHPNAACGSSPVVIQNKATAGLYYYTPYQPNATALSNLYGGQSDGCSSYGNRNFWRLYWDWFGNPNDVDLSPVGYVDSATANLTTATVRGWAFDPETSAPVTIHAYIGGPYGSGSWGGAYTANQSRPDVAAAYPAYGDKHGYSIDFSVPKGSTVICLYAINIGAGGTKALGCPTVSTPTGPPTGNFEAASISGGKANIKGWALDPDTAASINVDVYINGDWGGRYPANAARADVGAANKGYGNAHGFAVNGLIIPVGTSEICVWGIDAAGVIENKRLGCRSVSTATGPPIGSLDQTSSAIGSLTVSGWAIDPDTPKPIDVHVYVNGNWAGALTATGGRADVGRAYPGYGDNHGYSLTVPASGGPNTVCVYGINVGAGGANPLLACKTVQVPGGPPMGVLESVTKKDGTLTVTGWSIDPDTAASIPVHVYVNDGWGTSATASVVRTDVGKTYPGYGDKHGFQITLPAQPGTNKVCVFGINTGYGDVNPSLGCVEVK
jgi:hypothetical protein